MTELIDPGITEARVKELELDVLILRQQHDFLCEQEPEAWLVTYREELVNGEVVVCTIPMLCADVPLLALNDPHVRERRIIKSSPLILRPEKEDYHDSTRTGSTMG